MKVEIISTKQQWEKILNEFLDSGKEHQTIECDYYTKDSLYVLLKRYVNEFGMPIHVYRAWGKLIIARKDYKIPQPHYP